EEYNWNRCLKVELAKITEKDGAKRINIALYFGRSGKQPGFKVKPNSIYQFSFEAKGTASRASTKAVTYKGAGNSIWSEGRENAVSSLGSFPVEKEWKTYRGTFKTGPNAERASLVISLWGDSSQEKTFNWKVGDYLLLDNLRVIEKPSVVELGPKARKKIVDTKDYICLPAKFDNFINAKSGTPVEGMYSVEASLQDEAVKLIVTCKADSPVKSSVKENGSKIWADDVVEVFFGPTAKSDRTLSQFVLGAGGGRYIGNGNSHLNDYASWQAVSQVTENSWTAIFTIPFKLLGYDAKPAPGESILFNVSAQHDKQLFSWASVRGNFHDTDKYNVMVFGTPKEFASHLLSDIKECPEEFVARKEEIAKGALSPHDLNVAVLELKEDIKNYRLGNEKYLLGTLPVTGDYTLPLDVGLENVFLPPVKPIALTGAINETLSLPLTITNRTEETAAFRVILHPNNAPVQVETLGLDNEFPSENITLMEGIPMKDGDSFGAGLRFDALPKMNQAFTVTVPAGQTGLVWLRIECRNVKPGTYTGAIRVSPLSLPAEIKVLNYKGPMRD
ncbi:MAG: carbohydrate binding domain-containing protein, partial [Victivallales bacterium]|nr:carbohydrate binding domain-containing protein [Victivallales bacterium]